MVQGLLLDCDAATVTVWVNGERKGVMVRPGMIGRTYIGRTMIGQHQPVRRLEGPLRWAVDGCDCCMAIEGPLPPPA